MIVELICPGMLAPMALPSDERPATPLLDRMLVRSDARALGPRDPLETLAARFDVQAVSGGDLPSAPLSLLAETPERVGGRYWLHADPVHLHADRDRLLLFAGPSLDVTAEEAVALSAAFNDHFRSDGLELLVTHSGRWYLTAARAPDMATHPIHAVSGRPVDAFLPTGADARDWTRWQNEAQMLFFDHPVNRARERRGAAAISGIWPWGGGVLPRVTRGPDLVISDHPMALGLASAADVPTSAVGEIGGALTPGTGLGSVLMFWDRPWWPVLEDDHAGWLAAVGALEGLVEPLLAALMDGRIRALVVDDGASIRFEATRGRMRRFWRRGAGLAARTPS